MPAVLGSRISPIESPWATRENSSPFFSSLSKERRALGREHARRLAHDLLQQLAEIELRGDVGDDVQELHLLLPFPSHPLDEFGAPQRDGGLGGHRFEHPEVILGEPALFLVERLRDADDLVLDGPYRDAQDVAGHEAGLLVDRAVEALVLIGLVDDHALAGGKHVPRDAAGVEDPDLALGVALGDARVELAGLLVVQEQRAALGPDLTRRHPHQHPQHLIEGLVPGHGAGDVQEHLRLAQPPFGLIRSGARPGAVGAAPAARAAVRRLARAPRLAGLAAPFRPIRHRVPPIPGAAL